MNASEVLDGLNEMMMTADSEKSFTVLSEAVRIIKAKEQHRITVPCSIGDKLHSIIGEKVNSYVITGFRIDGEKVYMESQESMLFAADKIGQYYFWSGELAEREFMKKRHERTERI